MGESKDGKPGKKVEIFYNREMRKSYDGRVDESVKQAVRIGEELSNPLTCVHQRKRKPYSTANPVSRAYDRRGRGTSVVTTAMGDERFAAGVRTVQRGL